MASWTKLLAHHENIVHFFEHLFGKRKFCWNVKMTNINIALFEHFAQLNEDYMPWKLVCFLQHMHGNAVRKHYLFGTTIKIMMRAGGQKKSTIQFGVRE